MSSDSEVPAWEIDFPQLDPTVPTWSNDEVLAGRRILEFTVRKDIPNYRIVIAFTRHATSAKTNLISCFVDKDNFYVTLFDIEKICRAAFPTISTGSPLSRPNIPGLLLSLSRDLSENLFRKVKNYRYPSALKLHAPQGSCVHFREDNLKACLLDWKRTVVSIFVP